MHLRERKNVLQMIRVTYDASKKRGVDQVIGTIRLAKPEISEELRAQLTSDELDQFNKWKRNHHEIELLRGQLAGADLPRVLDAAATWLEANADSERARESCEQIMHAVRQFRRRAIKAGFFIDSPTKEK